MRARPRDIGEETEEELLHTGRTFRWLRWRLRNRFSKDDRDLNINLNLYKCAFFLTAFPYIDGKMIAL